MKKFRVDIVITNRKSGDMKFYKQDFANRIEAANHREEVLSGLKSDEYSHWAKIVTVVKCHCGEEVECSSFTNTCDNCDSDYNFEGSLLVGRDQWGEETGETASDILNW